MITRYCVICNTVLKYHQKFTCCHKCLGLYQHQIGTITFNCPVCGKEKSIPKFRYSKNLTCSRSCGKLLLYKDHVSLKKTFVCTNCQREFEKLPCQRRGDKVFCSRKCHYEWLNKTHIRSAGNNPSWKGGKYGFNRWGFRYEFEHNKELKLSILQRDGFVCQVCHKSHPTLHVHHIDFNGKNHSPSNLISLCPHCHRVIEIKKIVLST